ncbi:MAG: hypothetical protein J4432_01655 [DPANN group archaeon]|nr:hypothetical protein [DPANN group archaeon]
MWATYIPQEKLENGRADAHYGSPTPIMNGYNMKKGQAVYRLGNGHGAFKLWKPEVDLIDSLPDEMADNVRLAVKSQAPSEKGAETVTKMLKDLATVLWESGEKIPDSYAMQLNDRTRSN